MGKKIMALLLTVVSVFMLVSCASKEEQEDTAAPAGVAVQVKKVEKNDVSTENRVSGTVVSDNETSIYIAATAKCTAVYVEAGKAVEKGDIICTLDLGSTQASYNAAKISYESAAASYHQQKALFDKQIALTEKNISDTKALYAIGAAAQTEIDQAELQLMQLQAQRDSALAQLRASMENYRASIEQLGLSMDDVDSRGNVIAPASGMLASLNAKEGSYVSANYPVAVISDAEQMKISVYVSESLVPKLNIGDMARVSVVSAATQFTGVIRSVEQTANAQTKLYGVSISVPSEVEGLLSGMFADVTFYTDTSADTLAIPSEAILTSNGKQYVFVVENGIAKYTEITTGLTGDGVTEVRSGLSEGQELVVVGQTYVSDGDAVRVVGG